MEPARGPATPPRVWIVGTDAQQPVEPDTRPDPRPEREPEPRTGTDPPVGPQPWPDPWPTTWSEEEPPSPGALPCPDSRDHRPEAEPEPAPAGVRLRRPGTVGVVALAVAVLVVAYLGLALVGVVAGHVPRTGGQLPRSLAETLGTLAQVWRSGLVAANRELRTG